MQDSKPFLNLNFNYILLALFGTFIIFLSELNAFQKKQNIFNNDSIEVSEEKCFKSVNSNISKLKE